MLMKGSKIKMVKKVPGFAIPEGTVFTVDDIVEKAMISFSSDLGHGLMSYQEFQDYFEEIEDEIRPESNTVQKEEKWSGWEEMGSMYDNMFFVEYRQKGRMVQVGLSELPGFNDGIVATEVKATAKCSPYDEFDFDLGFDLAYARALTKWAHKRIEMAFKERNKKEW